MTAILPQPPCQSSKQDLKFAGLKQNWAKIYIWQKKESLPDRPKFCRSGSAVQHLFWRLLCVNTLRPRQNGRQFSDDIVKCIFSVKMYVAGQATSHYLNQWWLVCWWIYASLGLNELMTRESENNQQGQGTTAKNKIQTHYAYLRSSIVLEIGLRPVWANIPNNAHLWLHCPQGMVHVCYGKMPVCHGKIQKRPMNPWNLVKYGHFISVLSMMMCNFATDVLWQSWHIIDALAI